MSSYEEEQAAARTFVIDQLSRGDECSEERLFEVGEKAGFKQRAVLSAVRRLAHDGLIVPIIDGYAIVDIDKSSNGRSGMA